MPQYNQIRKMARAATIKIFDFLSTHSRQVGEIMNVSLNVLNTVDGSGFTLEELRETGIIKVATPVISYRHFSKTDFPITTCANEMSAGWIEIDKNRSADLQKCFFLEKEIDPFRSDELTLSKLEGAISAVDIDTVHNKRKLFKQYETPLLTFTLPFWLNQKIDPDINSTGPSIPNAVLSLTLRSDKLRNLESLQKVLDFFHIIWLVDRYLACIFNCENISEEDYRRVCNCSEFWNRFPLPYYSQPYFNSLPELCNFIPNDELKLLAVSFADLRDSSSISTTVKGHVFLRDILCGTEDNAGITQIGYYEAASKLAGISYGEVEQFQGDGVLTLFHSFKPNAEVDLLYRVAGTLKYEKKAINELKGFISKAREKANYDSSGSKDFQTRDSDWEEFKYNFIMPNQPRNEFIEVFEKTSKVISCFKNSLKWAVLFNRIFPEIIIKDPTLTKVGIGINIGEVLFSPLGSRYRKDVGVLGEIANYGSKLESHTSKTTCCNSSHRSYPLMVGVGLAKALRGLLPSIVSLEKFFSLLVEIGNEEKISLKRDDILPFMMPDENAKIFEKLYDRQFQVEVENRNVIMHVDETPIERGVLCINISG